MFGRRVHRGIGDASHRLRQGRRNATPSSPKTQPIGFLTDAACVLEPDHRSMDCHPLAVDIEAA